MSGNRDRHGHLHEVYQDEVLQPPSERSTGLVFAVVAALFGAFFLWHSALQAGLAAAGISAGFAGLALLRPSWLGPLNRAWFRLSLLMARVMNPLALGIIFFGIFTPFGLVMRWRSDPLRRHVKGRDSYWIDRTSEGPKPLGMQNQF